MATSTITPASGYVLPQHAIIIGIAAGAVCFWACTTLKQRLGYDDSLDVFGVHGIGGIIGTLAAGLFAVNALGGTSGLFDGNPSQVMTQFYGIVATAVWCGVVSFVLLKIIDATIGLRVSEEAERDGLDLALHGERMH